jgi:hypothetical protein
MKSWFLLVLGLLTYMQLFAQEIYITNNENELKILDVSNFAVTDVLTVDIPTFGVVQDIAFNPEGRLFATTSFNNLIEIDLITQQITTVFVLPAGATYPGLGANSNNELVTSKFLQLELYAYNIDTQDFTLVETDISTPGDFTYFKGNLIYPSFFNDFIKAYDGTNINDVGCSVPLLFGIVNVFEDCETNTIYAFDEDAKVYLYTLGESEFEVIADLWAVTGPIFGAATLNEYMASACTLESIETVTCDILSIDNLNPYSVSVYPNPVASQLNITMKNDYDEFQFEIWDITGRKLVFGPLLNNTITTNMLTGGIYILKIFDARRKQVFQQQLIKN